jgi:hypothetical protein
MSRRKYQPSFFQVKERDALSNLRRVGVLLLWLARVHVRLVDALLAALTWNHFLENFKTAA